MYYIVSFMPPGSMDRAARRIEQAETMAEAQAICRSRERYSESGNFNKLRYEVDHLDSNSNPGCHALGFNGCNMDECCTGGDVGKSRRKRRKTFIRGWESVPSRKGLATFPGSKININFERYEQGRNQGNYI